MAAVIVHRVIAYAIGIFGDLVVGLIILQNTGRRRHPSSGVNI
jgi:hypothetical protein